MRRGFAWMLTLWLALLSSTLFLFFKAQSPIAEHYYHVVAALSALRSADAAINEEVIRARYRQVVNYDPLVDKMTRAETLSLQVQEHFAHMLDNVDAGQAHSANERLRQVMANKVLAVEDFKSDNAVLKNSIGYFPATLDLVNGPHTPLGTPPVAVPPEIVAATGALATDVMQYVNGGGQDVQACADAHVRALSAYTGPEPLRAPLAHIAKHADVILRYADHTEQQVQIILAVPVEAALDAISEVIGRDTQHAFRTLENYRFGLTAAAALLLLYTAYMLIQLRRSAQALLREKHQAEVTLQSIGDAVIRTDAAGNIVYLNPAAVRILGQTEAEVHGRPLREMLLLIPDADDGPDGAVEWEDGTTPQRGWLVRHDDVASLHVECTSAPIRDPGTGIVGGIVGAITVVRDVTEARRLTTQLTWQATHDALTGMVNRAEFERCLRDLLGHDSGDGVSHAVLYIDLDQFKVVNDTCGHAAGDQLLRQIAVVIGGAVREVDVCARLGGDEFGVLLKGCPRMQALHIADNILHAIRQYAFAWRNAPHFHLGASIGLMSIPSDMSLEEVLSCADLACYAAKELGRNRVHVYEEHDATASTHRDHMGWVVRLTAALAQGRLRLYRQTIQALGATDRGEEHFEILLRLEEADGSVVLPGEFVPAAERYGLMPRLDRWVIGETCAYLAERYPAGHTDNVLCAVNLSGNSLNDPELLAYIRAQMRRFGIPPRWLCFEITETAAIANLYGTAQLIGELKRDGCQFALDDFGNGLSSLTYLKRLPVDYLKIDGSFVKDMVEDETDRAMVAAVCQIAKIMHMKIIAEWAETPQIVEALRALDVEYAQGYAVGYPEPLTPGVRAAQAGLETSAHVQR